jgi:hypothetical protein
VETSSHLKIENANKIRIEQWKSVQFNKVTVYAQSKTAPTSRRLIPILFSSGAKDQQIKTIMPAVKPQLSTTQNMQTSRYSLLATSKSLLGSSEGSTFSVNSPLHDKSNVKSIAPPILTKSVRFDLHANSCHRTWSREELSKESTAQVWYTASELKIIKSKLQTTRRMMRSGRFEEDNERHCFRGIDTDSQKTKRRERIARQLMAVFWCSASDYFDTSQGISLKLQNISRAGNEEAFLRAKQDRDHALQVYLNIA